MAAAAPVFTVRMALAACGVDDVRIFGGRTAAERMAEEMFLDKFNVCMAKTSEDIKGDLKSYASLTQAKGRIRILPGVNNKIGAMIQWV